ncbi:hypothetical protein HYW21_03585 [Candidatus Woesearchaeota archaeon]|nr:hypothetical protein [Candidatus Woesearchaeota archaeon]
MTGSVVVRQDGQGTAFFVPLMNENIGRETFLISVEEESLSGERLGRNSSPEETTSTDPLPLGSEPAPTLEWIVIQPSEAMQGLTEGLEQMVTVMHVDQTLREWKHESLEEGALPSYSVVKPKLNPHTLSTPEEIYELSLPSFTSQEQEPSFFSRSNPYSYQKSRLTNDFLNELLHPAEIRYREAYDNKEDNLYRIYGTDDLLIAASEGKQFSVYQAAFREITYIPLLPSPPLLLPRDFVRNSFEPTTRGEIYAPMKALDQPITVKPLRSDVYRQDTHDTSKKPTSTSEIYYPYVAFLPQTYSERVQPRVPSYDVWKDSRKGFSFAFPRDTGHDHPRIFDHPNILPTHVARGIYQGNQIKELKTIRARQEPRVAQEPFPNTYIREDNKNTHDPHERTSGVREMSIVSSRYYEKDPQLENLRLEDGAHKAVAAQQGIDERGDNSPRISVTALTEQWQTHQGLQGFIETGTRVAVGRITSRTEYHEREQQEREEQPQATVTYLLSPVSPIAVDLTIDLRCETKTYTPPITPAVAQALSGEEKDITHMLHVHEPRSFFWNAQNGIESKTAYESNKTSNTPNTKQDLEISLQEVYRDGTALPGILTLVDSYHITSEDVQTNYRVIKVFNTTKGRAEKITVAGDTLLAVIDKIFTEAGIEPRYELQSYLDTATHQEREGLILTDVGPFAQQALYRLGKAFANKAGLFLAFVNGEEPETKPGEQTAIDEQRVKPGDTITLAAVAQGVYQGDYGKRPSQCMLD